MRYIAWVLMVLSAGLWLGGLVALFLFAPAVFKVFGDDRATAGMATSVMFVIFAHFQLAAAAGALLGAFLGYATQRRTIWITIFGILAVAALGAIANAGWLVPKMEQLRIAGEGSSPMFKQLHGYSMILYLAVTAAVFVAITLMPAAANAKPVTPETVTLPQT